MNIASVTLEIVVARGNRGFHHGGYAAGTTCITCVDGFSVSVIAGAGLYCSPRPAICNGHGQGYYSPQVWPGEVECSYPGPFTAVEVGYPSERPEPWERWAEYSDGDPDPDKATDVYGYVPVGLVRDLLASHGGEVEPQ